MKWYYAAALTESGWKDKVMNCKKSLIEWLAEFGDVQTTGPKRWKPPGRGKKRRMGAAKRRRLSRHSGLRIK